MTFYELFSEMIKEQGWSQNFVSKEFKINRGLLYKYSKGEALIPSKKFHEILGRMPLSTVAKKALCEQYYKELYGTEKFAKIKHIEFTLSNLDDVLNSPIKKMCAPQNPSSMLSERFIYLYSETDIINAVNAIITTAESGEIITNYPYSFKSLDDTLFSAIVSQLNFDILHMLTFDKENDGFNNFDNIFCSIRWLSRQVNPMYSYSNTNATKSLLYPCYLIFNSYCLLFSPTQKEGLLVKSKEMYRRIKEIVSDFSKECFPLAVIPKDMLELKNEISRAVTDRIFWSISGYPCAAAIADKELIYSVIRRDNPGIEFLAQMAYEHYNGGINVSEENLITSASGLRKLAETGEIKEIPNALVHEMPFEQRIRYLRRMIELSDAGRLLILDDVLFSLPECIQIDFYTNIFQIGGYFENTDESMRHCGNYIINIADQSLRNDLIDFINYLRNNMYFYSSSTATSFLKSLIILCEQKIALPE